MQTIDDLGLTASPNPGGDAVRVTWNASSASGSVLIVISDGLGHELMRRTMPGSSSEWQLITADLMRGTYFVTVHVAERSASVRIIVP